MIDDLDTAIRAWAQADSLREWTLTESARGAVYWSYKRDYRTATPDRAGYAPTIPDALRALWAAIQTDAA